MPVEDTITYKVELDTSDVSGAIANLQDKISAEAGASAFMATPAPSQPFDFAQPFLDPGFGNFAPHSGQVPSLINRAGLAFFILLTILIQYNKSVTVNNLSNIADHHFPKHNRHIIFPILRTK